MERFAKIGNGYNYFRSTNFWRVLLYEINMMNFFNAGRTFAPEVFLPCRKLWGTNVTEGRKFSYNRGKSSLPAPQPQPSPSPSILPHFNFWSKQSPTASVSKIRDIGFYGCCSEIIRTRNFTTFTVHATIFGQFTAA